MGVRPNGARSNSQLQKDGAFLDTWPFLDTFPFIFWSEPLWQERNLKASRPHWKMLFYAKLKPWTGIRIPRFFSNRSSVFTNFISETQNICEQNNYRSLFSLRWLSLILYVIPFLKETSQPISKWRQFLAPIQPHRIPHFEFYNYLLYLNARVSTDLAIRKQALIATMIYENLGAPPPGVPLSIRTSQSEVPIFLSLSCAPTVTLFPTLVYWNAVEEGKQVNIHFCLSLFFFQFSIKFSKNSYFDFFT